MASKISIMPMELANKIAAGEVISRPASVIKELVENSIDALSKNIIIEIIQGGRTKILVSDDGIGMNRSDAILCFERHASSKTRNEYDLDNITSLGFRGEALPSISSVSYVTLETNDGLESTKIIKIPGHDDEITTASISKGTKFVIENLFFNTPARLKFLKHDNYEKAVCIDLISQFALSFPEISFKLICDGKETLKTTGRNDLKESIFKVEGINLAQNLINVYGVNNEVDFSGFVSKPEINYSSRSKYYIFVNRRAVFLPKLNKAIEEKFKEYIPPKRYPFLCLNINIDPFLVDVNVHPTKREIRVANEESIVRFISEQIESLALKQNNIHQGVIKENKNLEQIEQLNLDFNETQQVREVKVPDVEHPKVHYYDDNLKQVEDNKKTSYFFDSAVNISHDQNEKFVLNFEEPTKSEKNSNNFLEQTKSSSNRSSPLFSELNYLGQITESFLVFSSSDGMVLVDQHAAAERINFEYFRNKIFSKNEQIIPLNPVVLSFDPKTYSLIDNSLTKLKQLGIDVEDFGNNTLKISAYPSYFKNYELLLYDVIFDLVNSNKDSRDELFHLIVATLACKASIKANHHLSNVEVNTLIERLRQCENPTNCPHGRPTVVILSKYELEKLFKRTGFK